MSDFQKLETEAADCRSMDEVRVEIDRIDRELVKLIAKRQGYIEAAARIKNHVSEVRIEWRIDDVVSKVLAAAAREGLSERIAEPVWRVLIDRCIDHEHEVFESRHGRRSAKKAS